MTSDNRTKDMISDATRAHLNQIGRILLRLHKTILDAERAEYEGLYGRVNPGQMLQLLLNDPWFAWLRTLSELVVLVDEMAESKTPIMEQDADTLLKQIRNVLKPAEGVEGFGGKYYNALQHNPDAVLIHAEVSRLLPTDA